MRLIIAGGRGFTRYGTLVNQMKEYQPDVIICGMARGADMLGHRYAKDRGIGVMEMPADWEIYGTKAGYIRNEEMARRATHLLVFWDGISRGTKSMIELAHRYGLEIHIVRY